ncbi:amidase [Sphingomonas spermidinifaciens]|uniref:Amidase n=1 Tax=Sphingomonas spermidinifaciens TaxID=1141889 RepID=A0A2A4B8M0_9SPHN|nr:amidase [Sphingomonas spermidinifaciens]PCD04139.1 amidase [Sphingomonas spermidinifaciens]
MSAGRVAVFLLLAAAALPAAAQEASSLDATRTYLKRIEAIDRAGPRLNSVIAVAPDAEAQARRLDDEQAKGRVRSPVHGWPVLIKDNIETVELPTTAGSLALKDNRTRRDAPVAARLRAGGIVMLGKTNLSEWANIRSSNSMSGWSAVGGLVRNPYALDRTACGSSSGTGVAIAAGLARAGVGTETDGSVICPSAINGLVGMKPTLGLVSRTHVVPISHSQDTPGPMATSVRDAAALMAVMAGSDAADAATREADARKGDYAARLNPAALSGMRVGVLRPEGLSEALARQFDAALARLRAAGAVLVEVKQPETKGLGEAEFDVLKMELKSDLAAYLATTPPSVKVRTLADVIAFNRANAATEMPFFGQDIFEAAEKTGGTADPRYKPARAKSLALATQALDTMLAKVAVIVTPSYGAAWLSDPVHGDQVSGPSASGLPAVAGYPHLTVPMGQVMGLPVGLSFIGPKWSEQRLFDAGAGYEAARGPLPGPRYLPSVAAGPRLEGAE